jgi:oxygen-independent coproporphyrinogen-3 oxidase
MAPFLGFGVGASSMVADGKRAARPRTVDAYRAWVDRLDAARPPNGFDRWSLLTGADPQADAGGDEAGAGAAAPSGHEERLASAAPPPEAAAVSTPSSASKDSAAVAAARSEAHDRLLEGVMVALRTSDGLSLNAVARRFGARAAAAIARAANDAIGQGLAAINDDDDDDDDDDGNFGLDVAAGASTNAPRSRGDDQAERRQGGDGHWGGPYGTLRLTDPEGFLVSNDIISTVFAALDPSSVELPELP